jgi:hypothetical protein
MEFSKREEVISMKSKRISSLILASLTVGLVTILTVMTNALELTIQVGTPPPRPPAPRFHAPPEPVYVTYYSDAVLNVGSGYFGLEYPVVYAYSRDYNLTPDEVVYILYLSHYSHRSPTFVINIYQDYHQQGWTVMSRELGLRSGYPQWIREKNGPTSAVLYATSSYYNVPYPRVREIYTRGYQPAEIVVAMNISSRSGRPVNRILTERNKGKQWEEITRENKMTLADIKAPRARGKSVKFGAPLVESTPGTRQKSSVLMDQNNGKGKANPHEVGQAGDPHKIGEKGDPHAGSVVKENKSRENLSGQESEDQGRKKDQGKKNINKDNDNGKNRKKDKGNNK